MTVTWMTFDSSNQIHDLSLRFLLTVDVSLRDAETAVTGKHLDVAKRPSHQRYLASGVGDESSSPGVT